MLTLICKNLKNNRSLQSCLPRAFATENKKDPVRVRNFFELDPLFPDLYDPDRYTPPERLPLGDYKEKQDKKKRSSVNFFSATAKKQLAQLRQSRLTGKLNQKIDRNLKTQRKQKLLDARKEMMANVAENMLIDTDLSLPYGFGFDKFIFQLKEKAFSADTDSFLQDLDIIFTKLSYANDLELIEMHKKVIAEKSKDDYKEKARAILLDHVIRKIKELRQGKTSDSKQVEALFSDKEFIKANLSNANLDGDFSKNAQGKLAPDAVDNEARKLAEEKIDKKLAYEKQRRRDNKTMIYGKAVDYMEVVDPLYESDGRGIPDPNMTREDYESFGPIQPFEDLEARGVPIDQYRTFVKKETRKSRYLRAKIDYLTKVADGDQTENKGNEDVDEAEIITVQDRRRKEAADKTKDSIPESQIENEESRFFNSAFESDTELRNLLRETGFKGLVGKPTFEEALLEAERALSNVPISLRSKLTIKENEFSSQLHSVETKDLFWGNLSKVILPTVPKAFQDQKKKDDQAEEVEMLRKEAELQAKEKERLQPSLRVEDLILKMAQNKKSSENDQELTYNDLTETEQHELEIFKKIRKDPFFQHHIANHLSYFVDRNQDLQAKKGGIDANDEINFDEYPTLPRSFYENAEKLLQPKIYNGASFGKGSRKTCSALAVIKQGTGKITVNGRDLIDYFVDSYFRFPIVAPLYHTAMAAHLDVRVYLWGGGINAKSQAAQLAISRALVNLNPGFRKILKPIQLLRVDHRNVEPKHTGLYKARKKYPYNRR